MADSNQPETPETESETARKERVLHTRVPAILERELKKLAENMRMPVSNLVRAILEDALEVADKASGRVEEQLRIAVDRVSKERETLREAARRLDPLERMLAFQPVVLATATRCAKCGRDLVAGEDARLGIAAEPGPPVFACVTCVGAKSAANDASQRGIPPQSKGDAP